MQHDTTLMVGTSSSDALGGIGYELDTNDAGIIFRGGLMDRFCLSSREHHYSEPPCRAWCVA